MTIYPIPITEEYTFTAEKSVTVTGEETLLLSADEKEQLLLAWQRLVLSQQFPLWDRIAEKRTGQRKINL